MSGGYFYYKQFELSDIKDKLTIALNCQGTEDCIERYPALTEESQEIIRSVIFSMELNLLLLHEIDLFMSGDIDENTMLQNCREHYERKRTI